MRHRRRHTAHKTPELRSEEAFAEYSRRYPGHSPNANAEAIAQTIARKHCAGRQGTITATDILNALRTGPDPDNDASKAIQWMMGSISVGECMRLVAQCGVRYEDIARYMRARTQKREAIVRRLNQFTID